jgi:hypothetical protein
MLDISTIAEFMVQLDRGYGIGYLAPCSKLDIERNKMSELPSRSVTFLFNDVQDSTRLWEKYPADMRQVLKRHDEIIEGLAQNAFSDTEDRSPGTVRKEEFMIL